MKKLVSILVTFSICLTFMTGLVQAEGAVVGGAYISCPGAYVMVHETGESLYESNADYARPPGSITKVMSLYIVYDALANGEITLDTEIPISDNVYWLSRNSSFINVVALNKNETYTVNEMIDLIIVYSASAAVVAVAELVSGSEEAFVERMNEKSEELGIDATFYNCTGVEDNFMSPRAVVEMCSSFIDDYPDILIRSAQKNTWFHGRSYGTTNGLLSFYEGADGLKTGTSKRDGLCFVGTAERDGVRLIAVAMGSPSKEQRTSDVRAMLDYGFNDVFTRPEELIDHYKIVEDITYRGIINDKNAIINAINEDPNGKLYWLARKSLHYIRMNEFRNSIWEPTLELELLADKYKVANDLAYRGIVLDMSEFIREINEDPDGLLHQFSANILHYIRERD